MKHLHSGPIDPLDLQTLIQDQNTVGRIIKKRRCKMFRLVHYKRLTHIHVCLAAANGSCHFPTGIVSAMTAIQLLLRAVFAHASKNGDDILFTRLMNYHGNGRMLPIQLFRRQRCRIHFCLSGAAGNRLIMGNRRSGVFLHKGTAHAATLTGRHLHKAAVDISVFDLIQHGTAILHTVHRQIGIGFVTMLHPTKNTAGHREQTKLRAVGIPRICCHGDTLPCQHTIQFLKRKNLIGSAGDGILFR